VKAGMATEVAGWVARAREAAAKAGIATEAAGWVARAREAAVKAGMATEAAGWVARAREAVGSLAEVHQLMGPAQSAVTATAYQLTGATQSAATATVHQARSAASPVRLRWSPPVGDALQMVRARQRRTRRERRAAPGHHPASWSSRGG
jgi:hypothetical protein